MMNRSYRKTGVVLSLAIVGNLTAGCRGDLSAGTASSNSSTTSGSPSVGGAVDQVATKDAFKVVVDFQDSLNTYKYYLHRQGDAYTSGTCAVSAGSTDPNNNIYCFVDAGELDLMLKGASLRFNAPDGMCRYTKVQLYHYWGAQPGIASGTCTVVVNKDTGGVTQSCTGGSNLIWNGATYNCQFDYSGGGGPNCCEGGYTLIQGTTATPSGGGAPVTTYASPTTVKMTGSMASCLAGPGKTVGGFQDKFGYPRPVYYDSTTGRNTRLDFISPEQLEKVSTLSVANFWNPIDFTRTATPELATFPPQDPGDVPKGMQAVAGYKPFPYYEFGCLDGADDYVARIRVIIRGWDSIASFNSIIGDPYTDPTTHEPGFNNDYYIHDRSAWSDFAWTPSHMNQPLNDVYPGMNQ